MFDAKFVTRCYFFLKNETSLLNQYCIKYNVDTRSNRLGMSKYTRTSQLGWHLHSVTDILVQGVFTYGRMLRLAPIYLVFMSCM